MTIYLDYVFFINLLFDLILLVSLSLLLKRNIKIRRIMLGSLFGGISGLTIILPISSFFYFILKIIIGILLVIITFNYKDLKYTKDNLFYLIILSIVLGGLLYLLNLEFGNTKKLNTLTLLIISVVFMYIYIKQIKKQKLEYSTNYEVDVNYNNKCYKLKGYLDTGNILKDPYTNKPILITNKNIKAENYIYVPYNTVSGKGMMKCFKPEKVIIKDLGVFKNVLIGITDEKINISGVDIILNKYLLEDE